MPRLTLKGNPIGVDGRFPTLGEQAPDFTLVNCDLSTLSLADLRGKRVVFNIFPSVGTAVCAQQLKKFDQTVPHLDNTVLLFASLDLPFAFKRFREAKGITYATTVSDYRHHSLAKAYGVRMNTGALEGLYARAVLIFNEQHRIVYSEFVTELTNEPDYEAVMDCLASL